MAQLSKEDQESLERLRADADKAKLPKSSRRSRKANKFADFALGLDDKGEPFKPQKEEKGS